MIAAKRSVSRNQAFSTGFVPDPHSQSIPISGRMVRVVYQFSVSVLSKLFDFLLESTHFRLRNLQMIHKISFSFVLHFEVEMGELLVGFALSIQFLV